MVKEASITSDWNTSVRDTARNPPTSVYDATAIERCDYPGVGLQAERLFEQLRPAHQPGRDVDDDEEQRDDRHEGTKDACPVVEPFLKELGDW